MKDFDFLLATLKFFASMTGVFIAGILLKILWSTFMLGWNIFELFTK